MSTLQDERAELVAALAGLAEVHDHVPGRINPPCVVVTPGNPYIEKRDSDPFRGFSVNFSLELIMRPGANKRSTRDLDEHVETVFTALLDAGFMVSGTSTPYPLESGNSTYLALPVTVTTTIAL